MRGPRVQLTRASSRIVPRRSDPCCNTAPRRRRWALPTIFAFRKTISSSSRSVKHKNGRFSAEWEIPDETPRANRQDSLVIQMIGDRFMNGPVKLSARPRGRVVGRDHHGVGHFDIMPECPSTLSAGARSGRRDHRGSLSASAIDWKYPRLKVGRGPFISPRTNRRSRRRPPRSRAAPRRAPCSRAFTFAVMWQNPARFGSCDSPRIRRSANGQWPQPTNQPPTLFVGFLEPSKDHRGSGSHDTRRRPCDHSGMRCVEPARWPPDQAVSTSTIEAIA